ncbi:polyprenyl synthetase family protein [Kitasatospora sp. NPDC101235]|uniref:polyprenyl synthetase family protein n=1 Tax=Kitasatospora sp. NPDC101235 TaxID=3364101 RepID=UPI0037FC2F30
MQAETVKTRDDCAELVNRSAVRATGMVTPALRGAVDTFDETIRPIVAYHFGWADVLGRPTADNGGKMIRAALSILCGEACGGTPADLVPGAAAVELVHNFSLLHDDVMDRDVERRGRPTVWTQFGVPAAILAGDILLARACGMFDESTERHAWATKVLIATVNELAAGQMADLALESQTTALLSQPLTVAAQKTGALLRCSCELGAGLAGAPAEVSDRFAAFGSHLGLAFQLVDDILGVWGDPAVTGKPVKSDLRNRKKSIPVVAALNDGGPDSEELATLYAKPEALTETEIERAAVLVESAGGRAWTEEEIRRQQRLAIEQLDALDLLEEHREPLVAVADYISLRNR